MASRILRCFLALSLAAIVSAQLSIPVTSAMAHWELEVAYDGAEPNGYQILKVMKAFAQHYDDFGTEPPRSQFHGSHYHDAWNELRRHLRALYNGQHLATFYNSFTKRWFTCGLVYVRGTKKVGMCASFKSLSFPEPCGNPVQKRDGTYECPGVTLTTLKTSTPFCCNDWIMPNDKCASCTNAESNGDQRHWCNQSAENCAKCHNGRYFCQNSAPKVDSEATSLYQNRCCWGGSSCRNPSKCAPSNHWCSHLESRCIENCGGNFYCNKNAVPRNVQTSTRLLASDTRRSTATAGASVAVSDAALSPRKLKLAERTVANHLNTKSSVFFNVDDESSSTVTADGFFMRIIPVMQTADENACRKSALAAGGCQTLCCESQYRSIDFCKKTSSLCF